MNGIQINPNINFTEHLRTPCAAWLHNALLETCLEADVIAARYGQEALEVVLAVIKAPAEHQLEHQPTNYPKIVPLEAAVHVTLAVRVAKTRHALRSSLPKGILRFFSSDFHAVFQGESINLGAPWTLTQHLWRTYQRLMLRATGAVAQSQAQGEQVTLEPWLAP
jgi:hypothetical protein